MESSVTLEEIHSLLIEINKKIDILNEKNNTVEEKIINHILFVEKTYNILCKPMNYMKNKIESLMGYPSDKQLEYK